MRTIALGCAWMLCVVPLVSQAANVKNEPAASGCADAVLSSSQMPGKTVTADADEAEVHLTQQYALHRASLYLYNPAAAVQMADVPGLVEGTEH